VGKYGTTHFIRKKKDGLILKSAGSGEKAGSQNTAEVTVEGILGLEGRDPFVEDPP